MSASQQFSELPNFPFESFHQLQECLETGTASLGVDRYLPFRIVRAGMVSKGSYLFVTIMMWCAIWAVMPLFFFSWPSLGWWSLAMIPVGFISELVSRPWSSPFIVISVIIATIYGFAGRIPMLAWLGVAWIVVWFLTCGVYEWCKSIVRQKLESDEDFFTRLWLSKGITVELLGKRFWPDAVVDSEGQVKRVIDGRQ